MSRKNRGARYVFIVLLVALSLSMAGCLDIVNWGDPAGAQPGGEEGTAGQVIVEDAENVTETVSHDVSTSVVRTQHDAQHERVEVELTEEIDVDYMLVEFGGQSTARAHLYEEGDRVVLTSDSVWTEGEAEDRTRDLYGEDGLAGGPGGFAGVSYGDEVDIAVRSVEDGVGDVVHQETVTVGHGEVNAQVDYLFDSTENAVRVVLASNENADYVDVEFSMGNQLAEARLHEVGDEARISSDYPGLDTYGSAEDLQRQKLEEAVGRVGEQRGTTGGGLGNSNIELNEILSGLNNDNEVPYVVHSQFNYVSSDIDVDDYLDDFECTTYIPTDGTSLDQGDCSGYEEHEIRDGEVPDAFNMLNDWAETDNIFDSNSISDVDDLEDMIQSYEDDLEDLHESIESDLEEEPVIVYYEEERASRQHRPIQELYNEVENDLAQLKSMHRDLVVNDAADLELSHIDSVFLSYRGPVSNPEDVEEYADLLEEDVFDVTSMGEEIENVDRGTVEGQFERPSRDDIVDIQATARIEPSRSSSGIEHRGGLETEVLDVSGAIRSDGYVEVPAVDEEAVGTIELPSGEPDYETHDTVASLDSDRIAEVLDERLREERQNGDGYAGELEESYHLTRAAERHSETLLNNIDEDAELDSIRSGSVPAQTNEVSRAERYVRSGAAVCNTGSPSFYGQGSDVVLTLDAASGGINVGGVVERAGTSSTRVNLDGMAPVTVPNYALPLYDATRDWRAGAENVDAYVYDDLVEGDASETEVAEAIVDEWTDNGGFMDAVTDSSYSYQGVGVAVDEPTGVIYVTQSLC